MRHSLVWKLTLSFMVVAFVLGALFTIFSRINIADRLSQLLADQQRSSLQDLLVDYYSENHSWQGIAEVWSNLQQQTAPTRVPPGRSTGEPDDVHPDEHPDWQSIFGLADAQGVVLVSTSKLYRVGSLIPIYLLDEGTPITVDGQIVGTILSLPARPKFNPEENLFLQRTNEAMMYAVLGGTLTALLVGGILARTLTRPLKALTEAAQNIAMGQLEQEVRVTSNDEIGQLAAAFNRMALRLSEKRQELDVRAAELAEGRRLAIEAMRDAAASLKEAEKARREVEASYLVLEKQMIEIKALEDQLREQAIRDPLTNCYNRRYLEETLERECSRALREGYSVSIVLVDIDYFKQVNDTYGHTGGDELLKAISLLLQQRSRAGDVVCRYGGEEFLIMLPNLALECALSRAEEWRQAVENLSLSSAVGLVENSPARPFQAAGCQLQATISIGVASFPLHGSKIEEVIHRADQALYQAKNAGRNRVESCAVEYMRAPLAIPLLPFPLSTSARESYN